MRARPWAGCGGLRNSFRRLPATGPARLRPLGRLGRVGLLPVVPLPWRRGAGLMGPSSDVPVFTAPLRGALTVPILLAGPPRSVALLNGTLAAAVGLGR